MSDFQEILDNVLREGQKSQQKGEQPCIHSGNIRTDTDACGGAQQMAFLQSIIEEIVKKDPKMVPAVLQAVTSGIGDGLKKNEAEQTAIAMLRGRLI